MKHFEIWDRVVVTDQNGKKHKAQVTERMGNTYKLYYTGTAVTGTAYWPASSLTRDVEPSPSER